jgi:hypothetical protein
MRHQIPGFDHLASDWNGEGGTAELTYLIDCPTTLLDPILETEPPEDVGVQQVGRVSRAGVVQRQSQVYRELILVASSITSVRNERRFSCVPAPGAVRRRCERAARCLPDRAWVTALVCRHPRHPASSGVNRQAAQQVYRDSPVAYLLRLDEDLTPQTIPARVGHWDRRFVTGV